MQKHFLLFIKAIGPINNPGIPINLNPVYIAINVKIGCVPMFLLTNFGSKNCLVIDIIINKIIIASPNFKSPLSPDIIAQGTITVPDPKIGNASTNPIKRAINKGNSILNFANFNIYNPTKDIKNDTNIMLLRLFKYPPNICLNP